MKTDKTFLMAVIVFNVVPLIWPESALWTLASIGALAGLAGIGFFVATVAGVIRDSREDARVQREYEAGLSYERANRAERIGGGR